MRTRLQLSTVLNSIPGAKKVYFQPPTGLQMVYPCMVYRLDTINFEHADNKKYVGMKKYTVIVIDENPDSTIYESILELPYSSFNNVYVSDQLYHFVITLYY